MGRFIDNKQHRLPYFNYASTAWYFVTICTWQRDRLFGTITNGVMQYSGIGAIANEHLLSIPSIFPFAVIETSVVMPDHIHCLIHLRNDHEERFLTDRSFRLRPRSLSTVIGGYKSSVTARVRREGHTERIWKERFHDRIIRSEREWFAVRKYIEQNPQRWQEKMDSTGKERYITGGSDSGLDLSDGN